MLLDTGNYSINSETKKISIPREKVTLMIIPNETNTGDLHLCKGKNEEKAGAKINEAAGIVINLDGKLQSSVFIHSTAASQGYQLIMTTA